MTIASIEVVDYGPVYRASTTVTVHPGSPYRSMFMHGASIVAAWGFSADSAARRCADKRRRVLAKDEEVYQDRRACTSHYDDEGRRVDR